MIEFVTLSNISNQKILDVFNLSFSDYSISFKLNTNQLEYKMRTEDVNKAISVCALKDGNLIGFVLHADRFVNGKRKAYNARTGVIPMQRGQGLTARMYDFIKPILQAAECEEVMLEVISDNHSLLEVYVLMATYHYFRPVNRLR